MCYTIKTDWLNILLFILLFAYRWCEQLFWPKHENLILSSCNYISITCLPYPYLTLYLSSFYDLYFFQNPSIQTNFEYLTLTSLIFITFKSNSSSWNYTKFTEDKRKSSFYIVKGHNSGKFFSFFREFHLPAGKSGTMPDFRDSRREIGR